MSRQTSLLYYRPEAPKRLTPASLATFALGFAASKVSKPESHVRYRIKFGAAIDRDDRPTSWCESAPGSWIGVMREIEYDAEGDDVPDLDRMAEALDALPDRPIYRASLFLGDVVRPVFESLWREPSEENDEQLGFNLGWSLEAGPIASHDLDSDEPFRVGWLALSLNGQGYPYPWTHCQLVARAEGAPGFSRVLELCRRVWPVDDPPKPNRNLIKRRKLMRDLWPYDDLARPLDWSWGVAVDG